MALHVNQTDRDKVEAEIKAQEKRTSGEIVVVVASHCDDYIHVPIHIATGFALAVPLILPLLSTFFPWSSIPLRWIFMIQLIVFIAVALLFSIEPLRWWITPKSLKQKYASRFAAAEFLALELHRTLHRTGIMIFVALREHYVEIVTDTSVSERIPNAHWQTIVDNMLATLRKQDLTGALVQGVQLSGEALAQHFPPRAKNSNELPDKLVIVDDRGTKIVRPGGNWDPGD